MKIGLVSADPFYFPGGIQEHVKALYKELKDMGHEVKVIAPRYKEGERYGKDFILLSKSAAFSANASKANLSYIIEKSELKELLEKEDFDILHFHNIGFFLGLQILMNSDCTNIMTVHVLPDASKFYRFTYRFINYIAKRHVIKNLDGIIAVSRPILKYLPKKLEVPIRVISNGIDLKRFNTNNKKIRGFQDGKVNILFVGRLDKRKGLNYLIDAYEMLKQKHENIRLIVVGDGFSKDKWKKRVEKKKLRDVVFAGFVESGELPRYYATADVFCSPATYGESFGIVLLEAMASGKPVVAFANEGYRRILKGKGKKFLVKPKDTKALAKKIERLVLDEKLRVEMGGWGAKEARKYSWKNVSKEIVKFYAEVRKNGERNE